jgi:hypothetical protein
MTMAREHAMHGGQGLRFVLRLAPIMGALGMVAACAGGKSGNPTAQEVSAAVGRPDTGVTAGPTGGAADGTAAYSGLDDQERHRLMDAVRVAFAATTDQTTAYTVVPDNIDAEPTAVAARPAGPRASRPDGSTCRPIELSVTKQGRMTTGTLVFCQTPGSSDIKPSRAM